MSITPSWWPWNTCPARASQTRNVPSRPLDTIRLPSASNASPETTKSWPTSGSPIGDPSLASHTRMVLSSLAEAIRVPSRLYTTRSMAAVCPWIGAPTGVRVATSHN